MSEFVPIPISLEDVHPQPPKNKRYWIDTSVLADQEVRVEAMTKQAVKLANNHEFQKRIAEFRISQPDAGSPTEEEIRARNEQKNELFQWMEQFPGAVGLSEAVRYMAYVAVYSALSGPSST